MVNVEHALIFARAGSERLVLAERLLLALPELSRGALVDCDVRWDGASRFLVAVPRFTHDGYTQALRDRIAFWTARSGGRAAPLTGMSPADAAAFRAYLEKCGLVAERLLPADLSDALGRLFTGAGAPAGRRRSPREEMILALDVRGPGWEGVTYQPDQDILFLAGPIAPPVGDRLPLSFRLPRVERPVAASGIVLEVRRPAQAAPGFPAGCAIGLCDAPAGLRRALAMSAPESVGDARSAPRFRIRTPVKVIIAEPPTDRALPPPPPLPHALIEYATDEELVADFVENLSHGGAFVRTARPAPLGSQVALELRLPNGAELRAQATVAFANGKGMGVRFALDAEAESILSSAIALISARPRRALLVDDDELARRMLGEAFQARGFEVITAADAGEGLEKLVDEVLTLDLLLTDIAMPGMDGETFVRTIRRAGGESDLTIVAVSGRLDAELEARLAEAGADAALDKALGPELIAQAADAALEQKRLRAGG